MREQILLADMFYHICDSLQRVLLFQRNKCNFQPQENSSMQITLVAAWIFFDQICLDGLFK